MNTIALQWQDFERKVVPADAGTSQRREMRRAQLAAFLRKAADAIDSGDVDLRIVERDN